MLVRKENQPPYLVICLILEEKENLKENSALAAPSTSRAPVNILEGEIPCMFL